MRNSRIQPRFRLMGLIWAPRLLAVVRELRRSAKIGKSLPPTHVPGGGSSSEFWLRDRWPPLPRWRYRSMVSVPTSRIVALKTGGGGGRGRDTNGEIADAELSSPVAVASEGHYCAAATAGGGGGDGRRIFGRIGRRQRAPSGEISTSARAHASRSLAIDPAIRVLGFCLDEGSSSFWPGGRCVDMHGARTDSELSYPVAVAVAGPYPPRDWRR